MGKNLNSPSTISSQNLYRYPSLVLVGSTGKTHGIRGELVAHFTINPLGFFEKGDRFLFVEIDGLPVPFFLKNIRETNNGSFLVSFNDIDTLDKASFYVHSPLYAPIEYLEHRDIRFTWKHFIGFELLDQESCSIGFVIDVNDTTDNVLFEVENKTGKVILIPVNESLIKYIEAEKQVISVTIPNGLLSL